MTFAGPWFWGGYFSLVIQGQTLEYTVNTNTSKVLQVYRRMFTKVCEFTSRHAKNHPTTEEEKLRRKMSQLGQIALQEIRDL